MTTSSTASDHAPSHLAVRELPSDMADQILKALLSCTDYGVLLTDLDHTSLACNRQFGQIWGVPITDVVQTSADSVRQMVRHRVVNFAAWEQNLIHVYEDPFCEQIDEIELRDPNLVIRRYTGPVTTTDGRLLGRLWTFQNITADSRRHRIRESLHQAALFSDPDPGKVYRFITDTVGKHYQSLAILSIRRGDKLEFRAVGGPNVPTPPPSGNDLQDSFCQFCLMKDAPLIVQDARHDPRTRGLEVVSMGITRYLGVPVRRSSGETVGTLCIIDERANETLDEEDIQFLSLMAMRIGTELEREIHLQALKTDLISTQGTLDDTRHLLVQSEKLAIAGTLAASVAHDIRNILSSLRLRVAMTDEDPEETLQYVDGQLDRFSVLAHRLLSYARPNTSSMQPVDLHEIIDRVHGLLQGQAVVHQVELETDLKLEDPWIVGDSARLEHLLVNLVLNGLQALRHEGTIKIRTYRQGSSRVVEVVDDGPGVSPGAMATLFDPFTSQRADGFGLGLYSCRQIAEAHGATLTCESTLGRGATFRIRFGDRA